MEATPREPGRLGECACWPLAKVLQEEWTRRNALVLIGESSGPHGELLATPPAHMTESGENAMELNRKYRGPLGKLLAALPVQMTERV